MIVKPFLMIYTSHEPCYRLRGVSMHIAGVDVELLRARSIDAINFGPPLLRAQHSHTYHHRAIVALGYQQETSPRSL